MQRCRSVVYIRLWVSVSALGEPLLFSVAISVVVLEGAGGDHVDENKAACSGQLLSPNVHIFSG